MSGYNSRSPSPPSTPSRRRMKNFARKCERTCCVAATYFPLAFVYSLTTWAVWVDTGIGFKTTDSNSKVTWSRKGPSIIGVALYILLNTCYTIAVFTDPGSPSKSLMRNQKGGKYSVLPTSEPAHDLRDVQSITVSSTGSARFCKKCQVQKPDRAHHCSTCKRCVLKMDHHCPWLATCLGLHNYKAFVLFLIYTSIFCWVCFINTSRWMYTELFESRQYLEEFAPVNVVILAVLSGVIGLVLTGFTSWHLYLCVRGQTTIECLEKTRYLSNVRHRVEQNRQEQQSSHRKRGLSDGGLTDTLNRATGQILEFHANAVPGASRYEEGEEHSSPTPSVTNSSYPGLDRSDRRSETPSSMPRYDDFPLRHDASPAQRALRQNYSHYEGDRERERYEEYLEDKETEKLPNAFDLGWKKNLSHVFGPVPWLWWLPICNTTGDGWKWEVSQKWQIASEEAAKRKEERIAAARERSDHYDHYEASARGAYVQNTHSSSYGHSIHTQTHDMNAMSMQTLPRSGGRRSRRDFDSTGEDGVGSFEVSDSSSNNSSDNYDSDEDRSYRR